MNMKVTLHSIGEVNSFIESNKLAFLYVTMPNCSVCYGLMPQIEEIINRYPKIKMGVVDASEVEQIRGQFTIFTAPVLILFIDGKEHLREARIVHTKLLDEKLAYIYKNVVD